MTGSRCRKGRLGFALGDEMTMETVKAEIATRVVAEAIAGAVDVSVVIPCLNEANSIGICVGKAIEAFQAAGLRGEVVVADNGSTDGSVDIAGKLGARVVAVAQRG
jgi:hypothetical protein